MNEPPLAREERAAPQAENDLSLLVAFLCGVLAIRLLGLYVSQAELYFDEARYWVWAQNPDFGYFSKPPLTAWLVGLSTGLCGDSSFCVRLPSPLIHFATSLVLYLVSVRLFDQRAAFWAAVIYATLPGASVSAIIMSADVPFLFFWSVALLALLWHCDRPSISAGILLGAALGLGLNTKYAMIYLVPCLAVFAALTPQGRAIWRHPGSYLALLVAAVLFVPNVVWNVENDYVTFTQAIDVTALLDRLPNSFGVLEFIVIQAAVLGPVVFAAFVLAAADRIPRLPRFPVRFLLSFSAPIYLVVLLLAFTSQAQANWAVAAFPCAILLAVATMLLRDWRRGLLVTIGLAATVLIGASFAGSLTGVITSGPVGSELGKLTGWSAFAGNVQRISRETGIRTVVFVSRGLTASMIYELRESSLDVRSYAENAARPTDHFEMTRPWSAEDSGPVLLFFVGDSAVPAALVERAERIEAFQTGIYLARNANWIASAWRIN